MSFDRLRPFCSRLPRATIDVKRGSDEVCPVGGRMFAGFRLDGAIAGIASFRGDPARFLALNDTPGIAPAPSLARAHRIEVRGAAALPLAQPGALPAESRARVVAGLPRKLPSAVAGTPLPLSRSPRTRAGSARRTP